MSSFRRTLLLFSALLLLASLTAQGQVTLILTQPPPNQLRISDLWRVDLINSGRETVEVYLHGVATEARDGLIVDATSSSFMLPPGRLSVTGPTLEPIDVNESHPRYRDIVLRTGTVPTGEYEICVYVLAVENDQELGSDCISLSVERLTPPILISPSDETAIEEPLPLFTWTPPVPLTQTTRGVTYTIRIAEILGRQSAYDALQSNPAFYEKSGLPTSTFQFPSAARAFQSEKRYAWRVTAIRDGVEIGESEVWSFTRNKPEFVLKDQLSANDINVVKNNKDLKVAILGLKAERVVGGKGSSGALVASGKKQNDGDMATFNSGLQYTDATLWTWGNNEYGELGTGGVPVPSRATPTQVSGLTGMRAMAIGAEHTLAVDPSGNIATWGGNDFGQLGVGNEDPSNTPKWVAAFVNTLGVAAGSYHSVAIKGDGTVWTWGYNRSGELGLGDRVDRNTPKSTGLSGVIAVAAGDGHTLALKSDGTVWAWGTNRYGQAIPAFDADPVVLRPEKVEGLENVKAIAAGSNFSMALLGNGTVKTWGSNNSGQLGNGAADPDAALVYTFIISGMGGVDAKRKTAGGRFLSDAARPGVAETPIIGTLKGREAAEGTKRMGGGVEMAAGSFGGYTVDKKVELGYIFVNLTGINTVTGLSNAIAIDAGGAHAIALRSDSTAWTWGNNYWGTLGTGDEAFHGGPTRVTGLTGIESVAAGGDHTFAVQRDGTVMAWGNNMHKQLGMDDVPSSVNPDGEYSPSPLIVPKN